MIIKTYSVTKSACYAFAKVIEGLAIAPSFFNSNPSAFTGIGAYVRTVELVLKSLILREVDTSSSIPSVKYAKLSFTYSSS